MTHAKQSCAANFALLARVLRGAMVALVACTLVSSLPAAPDVEAFDSFHQAVQTGMETRLRESLGAAEVLAHGLSFVVLLLAVVTRLGSPGSDPFRSITVPLILAAVASVYPTLVRGLRDGVVAIAEQSGGHGSEARGELVRMSTLWLPPSSALAAGAAAETSARASGWAARLYQEIEDGRGLSEEARASLWQVASQAPSGEAIGVAASVAGGLLSAAAVAEAFGAAVHASSLEMMLILSVVAWAGLLLPVFSGVSRTVILQTAMAALWPLGWSIAHLCGVTLAEGCCRLVHAEALEASAGALADAGAIQHPASWIPAAVGVSFSGLLLLLAVPTVPLLSGWLASMATGTIGALESGRRPVGPSDEEGGVR